MQNLQELLERIEPLNSRQEEAKARLREIGLPNRKSESYRYFDVTNLFEQKRALAQKPSAKIEEDGYLEIVDGIVTKAPKGVEVCYKEATADALGECFDALYYIGHLLNKELISIQIDSDITLKVLHRFTLPSSLLSYRLAIEVASGASLTLFETFEGCDATNSYVVAGYDLYLKHSSKAQIIKEETLAQDTYTPIYSNYIHQDPLSSATVYSFDFGDADGLTLLQADLKEQSRLDAKHLLYAKGKSKRGIISQIRHSAKEAKSKQIAKSILQDSARGIFDAAIRIDSDAAATQAHQNSKALLLNSGAYMISKPQLEIYIDDVEASHGSTIGEIDEEQLFYLRARGIMQEEARKILILAFANEIIDAIKQQDIQESVHLSFERIYYGQGQLECIATCFGCSDAIIGDKA